ncbi:MAG: hypothetical protein ACXVP6_02330 [Bacteroidia bacterium]
MLSVFILAVIPAPLFHEVFANHTDVAENHCRFYHKDLGTHLEEQQDHCDVFKANTTLYDAVKFNPVLSSPLTLISSYKQGIRVSYTTSRSIKLPARAPPVS